MLGPDYFVHDQVPNMMEGESRRGLRDDGSGTHHVVSAFQPVPGAARCCRGCVLVVAMSVSVTGAVYARHVP